jgi:hypothetical protein
VPAKSISRFFVSGAAQEVQAAQPLSMPIVTVNPIMTEVSIRGRTMNVRSVSALRGCHGVAQIAMWGEFHGSLYCILPGYYRCDCCHR